MPRDLITSTMKSEPVLSVVSTSTPEGSSSFGIIGAVADCAGKDCGAAIDEAVATNPAAPAAAPFKNLRRSTESFFAIGGCSLEELHVASRRLLMHRRISQIDGCGVPHHLSIAAPREQQDVKKTIPVYSHDHTDSDTFAGSTQYGDPIVGSETRAPTVAEIIDQQPLSRFQIMTIGLCALVMV